MQLSEFVPFANPDWQSRWAGVYADDPCRHCAGSSASGRVIIVENVIDIRVLETHREVIVTHL